MLLKNSTILSIRLEFNVNTSRVFSHLKQESHLRPMNCRFLAASADCAFSEVVRYNGPPARASYNGYYPSFPS